MKASTTILSGIILVILGIALTMAPALFSATLDLVSSSPDTAQNSSNIAGIQHTLIGVITGNIGLLIGVAMVLLGLVYILALPILSHTASLDVKIIIGSALLIFLASITGFYAQDFPEYDATKYLGIPVFVSILLIACAPFASLILPGVLKNRRDFEDAKISADKLFSYASSHNRTLQKLQDKIEDLEKQEEILKSLMGEEKIESVFKLIDRRERNTRISTFMYGIVTGVISTFISSLIF